jgi:hypothetical protein
MFCSDVPTTKQALMLPARSQIATKENGRDKIEGITPIIAAVHERFKAFLVDLIGE